MYKLQDLKGEDSTGIYYEDELSPYDETNETTYKVVKSTGKENIERQKVRIGKVQRLARKSQRVDSGRKRDC